MRKICLFLYYNKNNKYSQTMDITIITIKKYLDIKK